MIDDAKIPWNQIWAAACAAQRINGAYIKRSPKQYDQYNYGKNTDEDKKLTNVALMRIFLRSDQSDLKPKDFEQGKIIRDYFCGLLHLVFSDDAGKFIKAAVQAASTIEMAITDIRLPLIAALPNMYFLRMEQEEGERSLEKAEENNITLDEIFSISYACKGANFNKRQLQITVIAKQNHREKNLNNITFFATANFSGGRHSLVMFLGNNSEWGIGKTYDITITGYGSWSEPAVLFDVTKVGY